MASSGRLPAEAPESDALRRLGAYLTGTEAADLAARLVDGETLTVALRVVALGRREEVRQLLRRAGLRAGDDRSAAVLLAVAGAHERASAVTPVWTMPGHTARSGPLTTSAARLVDGARQSVTVSTFNVQRSSGLWAALIRSAARPEVVVRLYLDARAADGGPNGASSPSSVEVAVELAPSVVLRSRAVAGRPVRNHAKFVVVDHRFVLVTSANLSWSAERTNVELGLLVDDAPLAESIERQMRLAEDALYEVVARP